MVKAFTQLERVLKLEAEQGYQNKAVVGGIRQFATFWVGKARDEAVDELDVDLVEQIASTLQEYGRLQSTGDRANTVQELQQKLQRRKERVAHLPQTGPRPQTAAQPPPTQAAPSAEAPEAPLPSAPSALKEAAPDPEGLKRPTSTIKGVGSTLSQRLSTLGAETIGDLLYIFPRRYDDYSLLKPINRLQYGDQVTIIGTIWETRARRTHNNQTIVQSIISDGTDKVQATWFNQPWLTDKLTAGTQIVISGAVEQYLGRKVFNSPEWEPLSEELLRTGRIVPVYPLTKGLGSNKMRQIMKEAVDNWAARVPDPMPETIRERQDLLALPEAIFQVHFPTSRDVLHQARRRLAFDELFLLQLGMLGQRRQWQSDPAQPLTEGDDVLQRFISNLPFQLTGAQQRVTEEIRNDMARDIPMNRLLQGDVGSGKTVVAAAAMVIAVANGAQAAMMAPTEILAEQHYQGLNRMLSDLDINMRLLTGSATSADRSEIYAGLSDGSIDVIIGTHALIQDNVQFNNLGLAVIDEQHRFGVDQRAALRDKGISDDGQQPARNPHLLVMSATPIPRTLALSLYGDLDISILDEMPPGREEITTRWIRPSERERAYAFVRGQIQKGRQAYIICPLVEESDKIEAKAAVEEHARLQEEVFPDLKLGLLHGRMKGEEKESIMRDFYRGETDILVSTSVIEVGVDVPNSTVMVIEGANRFGLAQLHQFRGRVGRGEHRSYCLLISDAVNGDAEERLLALEQSNDGFMLAEKDLELRGPGEFFGRRQSGIPELYMASLLDVKLLETAREEAQWLFEVDPDLEAPEHAAIRQRVEQFWDNAADIS
ncbi:MAG TPA: ATP-dependent DNA helicase RecG [Candidatus Sulfomarinibacteraceae bacterium]|nr:ATP-dependent DNA helicase RecG [Candidatus Sulfomarinibacteraceae bacterium]